MGLFAKLYVDGKEFTVLVSNHNMRQGTDWTGKPNAMPVGGMFTLVFESTGSTLFFEWMVTEDMMKEAKLVFSPVTLNGKSRTIKLLDTHCIHYKEHFLSDTLQPMTITVVLSPATIVENGEVMLQKHWFITDPNPVKVEPTPEPIEKKKQIIDFYYTDLDGNKDAILTFGKKAYLVLRSKNMIGETVDLKLDNKVIDFVYNERRIKDDVIKGYTIKSNTDKIPVEVI